MTPPCSTVGFCFEPPAEAAQMPRDQRDAEAEGVPAHIGAMVCRTRCDYPDECALEHLPERR